MPDMPDYVYIIGLVILYFVVMLYILYIDTTTGFMPYFTPHSSDSYFDKLESTFKKAKILKRFFLISILIFIVYSAIVFFIYF